MIDRLNSSPHLLLSLVRQLTGQDGQRVRSRLRGSTDYAWRSGSQAFAMDSICDRHLFAWELAPSRTADLGFGEKGRMDARRFPGSPFSAVRPVEQKSRKTGIIREFPGK